MVVTVENLTLGYGERAVVSGFSLVAGAGEAVALRGPNGVGKSTLLRCVAGLHKPRQGIVTVAGAAADERAPGFRRAVAAMLDDASWYPSLTVEEHIDLVRMVNAPDGDGARPGAAATGLLDRLALTTVAGESPVRLSSGQRQRLALAMTFARPSRVLLLDEPERHLDAAGRATVAELLREYRERGGTALIATHDGGLAATCRAVDLTGPGPEGAR